MFSKPVIVAALAAGFAAAAGGAYVSVQDDREVPVAAAPAGTPVANPSPAPAVAETEAIVTPPAAAPTSAAAAPVAPAAAPVGPAAAPVEPAAAPVDRAPRRERRAAPR